MYKMTLPEFKNRLGQEIAHDVTEIVQIIYN